MVGDEGDEEAALAHRGVPDQQYLEGVIVAMPRARRRTHDRSSQTAPKQQKGKEKGDSDLDLVSSLASGDGRWRKKSRESSNPVDI